MNRTTWLSWLLLLAVVFTPGCGASTSEPTAITASIEPSPLVAFQYPCRTIGGVPLPCASTLYIDWHLILVDTAGSTWTLESVQSRVVEERSGRVLSSRFWSQAEISAQNTGNISLAAANTLSVFFLMDLPEGRRVPSRLELLPHLRSQSGDTWNGSVVAPIATADGVRP